MTDFLTDLLDRSRGEPAGLMPRIPALFESADAGSGGSDEPDATADAAVPDVPRRRATPPVVRAVEPAPLSERSTRLEPVDVRTVQAPVTSLPSGAEPPPVPGPLVVTPHATGPVDDVVDDGPPATPRRTAVADAPPVPAPEPLAPVRPDPVALEVDVRPAREVGAEPAARGSLTVPPPVGLPAVPETADAGHRAADPATPSSETTVHVTIGRVEVRAVPAPQPQRRPDRPASAMSLDDYLGRRNQRRQV